MMEKVVSRDGTPIAVWRSGKGRPGPAAVVEAAAPEVDLLGHSYGAVCALEAAAIARGVRKLVLYEPPLGFVHSFEQVYDHLQELLDAGRPNELLSYFLQEVAGLPPDQVDLIVMPGQRHAAIDTGTELFTSEVLSFLRDQISA